MMNIKLSIIVTMYSLTIVDLWFLAKMEAKSLNSKIDYITIMISDGNNQSLSIALY